MSNTNLIEFVLNATEMAAPAVAQHKAAAEAAAEKERQREANAQAMKEAGAASGIGDIIEALNKLSDTKVKEHKDFISATNDQYSATFAFAPAGRTATEAVTFSYDPKTNQATVRLESAAFGSTTTSTPITDENRDQVIKDFLTKDLSAFIAARIPDDVEQLANIVSGMLMEKGSVDINRSEAAANEGKQKLLAQQAAQRRTPTP